ncbi:MAG: transcription termination factor NusA [Candidatus Marinimicrobia bacterium]|nr:transcription termination factor NusA [Candidatus Neomarinimicrobiota bacterium]
MDQKQLIEAFTLLAREKNMPRAEVGSIIESVIESLIKRKFGDVDNFDIIVNTKMGEIEIYQELEVVSDEDMDDEVSQISLTEAEKMPDTEDVEIGELVVKIISPDIFGRRSISAAKQILNQRIIEIEREQIFNEYKKRIGEIVVGNIHQARRNGAVFINNDKIELKMPRGEQIPTERYRRGYTIKAVIKDVLIGKRGPEIIISRSDELFLRRLFELEVPEIYDGIVDIKTIARIPGKRCKIVVTTNDKRIDPVGACVGIKGSRIKTIVNEIGGENIDIINHSVESELLISRALSPAKPLFIEIDEERKYALAVFEDDEIATAIGIGGVNINLTSRVTGYEIDAIRQSEYNHLEGDDIFIEDIDGITEKQAKAFQNAEIETVADFLNAETEELLKVDGIGEKTFEKIELIIQNTLEEKRIKEKEEELDLDKDDVNEDVDSDTNNKDIEN